jgi:RNA polymerase sigma factor (sigma-70 family)
MSAREKTINFYKIINHAARKDFGPLGEDCDQIFSFLTNFLLVRTSGLDKATAESLAQESIVTIMEKALDCRAKTNDEARNWVITIAVNQSYAYLRKANRLSEINPEYKKHAHTDNSADKAKIEFAALAKTPFSQILTEREHEALELHCQGYKNVEIAKFMKVSKSRITQLLKAAIRKLKEHLKI